MPLIAARAQPLSGSGYQVLYRFQGDASGRMDGFDPQSDLIAVKDNLYGTTSQGGEYNYSQCGDAKFFAGCGTVFEVNTSGEERVLYRFVGDKDGYYPSAGLVALNGTLYGTTVSGGGLFCKSGYYHSCGTVFALSLSGQEHVLHSFSGLPDGDRPSANLIAVNGMLYGTAVGGGSVRNGCIRSGGCGVVFQVSPSGSERVLHAFRAGKDGAFPSGPLISVHGTLYGVTGGGGSAGCGTVFKVSTSGSESVLYSFSGSGDGCGPQGSLAAINGVLYGVTHWGGSARVCHCGTVFKVSTTGTEKVIYNFQGGGDGEQPVAGVIALDGALYGTTFGGGGGCAASLGCGTVFKISTTGVEQVLHAFKGGTDGAGPVAGLRVLLGTLYGTTAGGGDYSCGPSGSGFSCGTVFKILP